MGEILLSGTLGGSSAASAGHLYELRDPLLGSSIAITDAVLVRETHGFAAGDGSLAAATPGALVGIGQLWGTVQVNRRPHTVAESRKQPCFRWGHQFRAGDLVFHLAAPPVCIGYALYRIERGCVPKQMGPAQRTPGSNGSGVYYATGTAGECGQPGLWMIRWCYREAFDAPPVSVDCYFWVMDAVLCAVEARGTLPIMWQRGWG